MAENQRRLEEGFMGICVDETDGDLVFFESVACPSCGEIAEFDGHLILCDYCSSFDEEFQSTPFFNG